MLLFDRRSFGAWWFETGTPAFLIKTLVKRGVSAWSLEGMKASATLLSSFDVDGIAPEALLFQTGYLTIAEKETRGRRTRYRLGCPNREVRECLNGCLLRRLVRDASRQEANSGRLHDLLLARDFDAMKTLFHSFYTSIPCE